ncbi:hypothetical protein D3C83_276010 [compost metagenome]
MQHEAAIGLHRAAEVDRRVLAIAVTHRERQALEQRLQGHVDGAVDDDAERALVVVLADVSQ